MNRMRLVRASALLTLVGALGVSAGSAEAGSPPVRRSRRVETQCIVQGQPRPAGLAPSPMLGTFYPTPYITVRGDGPVGGGYTPIGQSGGFAMSLYGPTAALRQVTAPVLIYQRGYDGVVRPTIGTSFSYPNKPDLGTVVYPTRASNYNAPRTQTTPPWWDSGMNWIDQN
jgi:hypothetical protein